MPWQQWTETSVWFDDVGISTYCTTEFIYSAYTEIMISLRSFFRSVPINFYTGKAEWTEQNRMSVDKSETFTTITVTLSPRICLAWVFPSIAEEMLL
jgi:hypothetical protein